MRWSSEMVAMLPRITSNLPLRMASLYSQTAISTMKLIGNTPLAMPSNAAPSRVSSGMPNTSDDTSAETPTASSAAVRPLRRSTVSASRNTSTGSAASSAERFALPSGS